MPLSWDAFLTRYGPMARALASQLVRPPATAEDVVQEAALALHRALARDPERFADHEHARNYFLRAARNLALKSRRDEDHEEQLAAELPAASPDDPAARVTLERQRALGRLLVELDPAERELIARRFLEHQTLARIARETGVPVSTLHDREKTLLAGLRRRLAALERELDREFDQEEVG
jgi:RNA polymerase sigma factor (sigma-70 family)